MNGNAEIMRFLEGARGWAAQMLKLVAQPGDATAASPNVPRVVMVSRATGYITLNGKQLAAGDMDVCVRQLAMQRPHKALAVTGSICTAVAACIPGSVVAEFTSRHDESLRLGHPSGVTTVRCVVSGVRADELLIEAAEIDRSARLLMHGTVMVRKSQIGRLMETVRK
jgi:2-methylaconitate cis-trans-isomerase PrpF